ncbi:hypothetical protein IFT84_17410 [Rhizobium sp. CFBP 8762]|uniref:phage baseplate plug family protein n=1 Tax=Rhizobium sp. CFBP 8762 TaxID=2775279 RepID=UPI0017860781|nr:hypothetical protein [Rhizobium sp. CFBP 8762]MBD8556289.1 hypothetical protein [Rhizobium sp. CFBP 8762]
MISFTVSDQADQQFSAVVSNRRITLRLRYNPTNDRWSFDLSIDDTPVLHGRRIVIGVDLLAAFDFGVGVIFAAPVVEGAEPNRVQLPNGSVKLLHATQEEAAAASA